MEKSPPKRGADSSIQVKSVDISEGFPFVSDRRVGCFLETTARRETKGRDNGGSEKTGIDAHGHNDLIVHDCLLS